MKQIGAVTVFLSGYIAGALSVAIPTVVVGLKVMRLTERSVNLTEVAEAADVIKGETI